MAESCPLSSCLLTPPQVPSPLTLSPPHFLTSHPSPLQGTSADQDNRFSDKEKKLLNSMRFDEALSKKVDMKKVG